MAARRTLPHIYTPEQLAQIVAAAGLLRETYTLRRRIYATLFGMIAATGLRISEALCLRLGDVLPGGVLRIERTKFGKSRLVPLHPTVEEALGRYLDARRQLAEVDDHVFLSAHGRRIGVGMADYTFRRVLRVAGITSGRERACRVHDLRHTFATRVRVNRHPMLALTHFWWKLSSRGANNARLKEIELSAAIHLAFDELQLCDLPLRLAVRPG